MTCVLVHVEYATQGDSPFCLSSCGKIIKTLFERTSFSCWLIVWGYEHSRALIPTKPHATWVMTLETYRPRWWSKPSLSTSWKLLLLTSRDSEADTESDGQLLQQSLPTADAVGRATTVHHRHRGPPAARAGISRTRVFLWKLSPAGLSMDVWMEKVGRGLGSDR